MKSIKVPHLTGTILIGAIVLLLSYLMFWPTVIQPVAWQTPDDQGLTGDFIANDLLAKAQNFPLPFKHGPEDFAVDSKGIIYTGTDDGSIFKLIPAVKSSDVEIVHWTDTGGRVLGIEFDQRGQLIAADADLGLMSIDPSGRVHSLINEYQGEKFGFIDDLDITDDGRILFSDASSKFKARDFSDAYSASRLDINEHGSHGRVFVFNPADESIKLVAEGINFANGIAISFDQKWVLVNETGSYRILKFGIAEDNFGQKQILIDNLPGFPDNISRGENGLYWFGLVSPRNALLDFTSSMPWLRSMAQRMPTFLQPKAQRYGHIAAINDNGEIAHSLQGDHSGFSFITGGVEQGGYLYLSSLHEGSIARVKY